MWSTNSSLESRGPAFLSGSTWLSRCSSSVSLPLLTVVIDSAVNMGAKMCLNVSPAFDYFGSIPGDGIAG